MNSATSAVLVVFAGILIGYGSCKNETHGSKHYCIKASADADIMTVIATMYFNTSVHNYNKLVFGNASYVVENDATCTIEANFTEGFASMVTEVNCSASPAEVIDNPCGAIEASSNAFEWIIGFREWENESLPLLTLHSDVDFTSIFCDCNDTTIGQLQSDFIKVDKSPIEKDSKNELFAAELRVVDATTQMQVTDVGIGDELELMVIVDLEHFVEDVSTWGIAVGNCIAAPTLADLDQGPGATYLKMLKPNGCSINTDKTYMPDDKGFTELSHIIDDKTYQWNATTEAFKAFKFHGYGRVYFQCDYVRCSGAFRDDQKCLDFCAYSLSLKRKKRQADSGESGDGKMTVEIRITGSDSGTLKDEPESKKEALDQEVSTSTVVIVAGAVGGVLLLTVLFVVIAAVILLGRRRRIKKEPKAEISGHSKANF